MAKGTDSEIRTPEERVGYDRSLGDLFRELASETSDLLRQELALARTELQKGVQELSAAVKQLTIGSAIALVGVLTLTAFAVVLLGSLLANYWLGALIVSVVLLGIGGFLIFRGLGRLREAELAPRETLESLRVSGEWVSEEAAELRNALSGETNGSRGSTAAGGTQRALLPAHAPPRVRDGSRKAARSGSAGDAASRGGGKVALLKRVGREVMEDEIPGEAAKVAYYAFLALPPAILVSFALLGFFGGSAMAEGMNARLQAALPDSAAELVEGFVDQIVNQSAPGPFSIGLLLALWAASNVFVALGESLNTAYDVGEDRSWVKRRALAVGTMLASVFLMLIASVSLIAGPQIANALNLWGAAELAWTIIQWPLAFLFVAAAFFLVYYVLPNRDQSACKPMLFKAAMVAAALWLVASAGFRLYIGNFASYSETYGLLGSVIVLLLWLYVTGLVVLVGGELASEMEEKA
jgi:membrane protein